MGFWPKLYTQNPETRINTGLAGSRPYGQILGQIQKSTKKFGRVKFFSCFCTHKTVILAVFVHTIQQIYKIHRQIICTHNNQKYQFFIQVTNKSGQNCTHKTKNDRIVHTEMNLIYRLYTQDSPYFTTCTHRNEPNLPFVHTENASCTHRNEPNLPFVHTENTS